MNGKVVQRYMDEGKKVRAHLLATDGQAEAAHVPDGSDVWLNSGDAGKMTAAPGGWPKYTAEFPGSNAVPKGTLFTTDRERAASWIRELARKMIPSPLVSGPLYYRDVWRPLDLKLRKAQTMEELWGVLQEIQGQRNAPQTFMGQPYKGSPDYFVRKNAEAQSGFEQTKQDVKEGVRKVGGAVVDLAREGGSAALDIIPDWAKIAGVSLGVVLLIGALVNGSSSDEEE